MPTNLLSKLRAHLTQQLESSRDEAGGALGTPSHDLDEAPPSLDQEANQAVSGGGMVGPDAGPPRHKAARSR